MPQDNLQTGEYKRIYGTPARLETGYTLRPDEFIRNLRGYQSHRAYREMRDNSSIIGGALSAFELLVKPRSFRFDPADDTPAAEEHAELAQTFLDDIEGGFDAFLTTAVGYLAHGFSAFEVVMKVRGGRTGDTATDSKQDDGLYGYRMLDPRAQWTIYRWNLDEENRIVGLEQNVSGSQIRNSGIIGIPIGKLVIFRNPAPNRDPSGRSILRNAYRNWFYASRIEEIEAVGIERDASGIPVGRVPMEWTNEGATPGQQGFVREFDAILRDVKSNDQSFLRLPSNTYMDADGKPTGERLVDFELVASNSTRSIVPDVAIQRHQKLMAASVLADFLLLGQDGVGSYALSQDKTHLFLRSVQAVSAHVAETIDEQIIRRIWEVNDLDPDLQPKAAFDDVTSQSTEETANMIRVLGGAGMPLFPDVELENVIRRQMKWPEVDEDRELNDPDMRVGLGLDIPLDPNKTPPDDKPGDKPDDG